MSQEPTTNATGHLTEGEIVNLVDPDEKKRGRKCTLPIAVQCVDLLDEFSFPTDKITREILRYKSFNQIDHDTTALALRQIANDEHCRASSFSETVMETLSTTLSEANERAKSRFFLVKLWMVYEIGLGYITVKSC
jgi:hypothetical protein